MKLIGFSQLRNEHINGNLVPWLDMMCNVCDYVYIFDQNSTDGSDQVYLRYNNAIVTHSPTNLFQQELQCKQQLMDRVYADHSDVNWILWLDGDTFATCSNTDVRTAIRTICTANSSARGVRIPHYNLWRSDTHYRTDNNYHWLHHRRVPLWNAAHGRLKFNVEPGLHKIQKPIGILPEFCPIDTTCSLLHRGFATDRQIINRYDLYKSLGQTGPSLERLLDEAGLTTSRLPQSAWHSAFTNDVDPSTLTPIRKIYEFIPKL